MTKLFYTCGFLYHLSTQQILLHQSKQDISPKPVWKLFGGMSRAGEDAQSAFGRIVFEQLELKVPLKNLLPVYDYVLNTRNIIHYVLYAEVSKLHTVSQNDHGVYNWFTMRQITKLPIHAQSKHDIVVSERVINAEARSHEPIVPMRPGMQSNLYH